MLNRTSIVQRCVCQVHVCGMAAHHWQFESWPIAQRSGVDRHTVAQMPLPADTSVC